MNRIILAFSIIFFFGCTPKPIYYTKYSDSSASKVSARRSSVSKSQIQELIKKDKSLSKKTFNTSYYGKKFHGKPTSNGEVYDMYKFTAAHKTLPFNTKLKLTDPDTGKSVIVRINDRGPFVEGRDLDISYAAAKKIGLIPFGHKELKYEILEDK